MSGAKGLVATDLDGTLAVNGHINDEDRKAAGRLKAAGIAVLVITGRNLRSLGRTPEVWDVADSVLFSSGSGLLSSRHSAPKELHRLSGDEVRRIVTVLDTHDEDFCLLDPVPNTHNFAFRRSRPRGENPDFESRMAIYEEWARDWHTGDTVARDGACQVLVIRPPDAPERPGLNDALTEWSVFHSSSPIDHQSQWLEIFPAGVDKGRGLFDWCRQQGIATDRVLALGNDFNDGPMFAASAYPRVVANAPPDLREQYKVLPAAGEGGFAAAAEEALALFT